MSLKYEPSSEPQVECVALARGDVRMKHLIGAAPVSPLTPNTVDLIPTIGAFFPEAGPSKTRSSQHPPPPLCIRLGHASVDFMRGGYEHAQGTPTRPVACPTANASVVSTEQREREFFIDNLLVRIQFIIVMIRWTGLAPWEFESTEQLCLPPRRCATECLSPAFEGRDCLRRT